jgi:hypothetical protein
MNALSCVGQGCMDQGQGNKTAAPLELFAFSPSCNAPPKYIYVFVYCTAAILMQHLCAELGFEIESYCNLLSRTEKSS